MATIVILGAGTAGTLAANRLRRRFADDVKRGAMRIVVVDQDNRHVYQPGLLFVPFGIYHPDDIVRSRRGQLHDAVEFRLDRVRQVHAEAQEVELAGGERLPYDVCIVATGARLAPELTPGLDGAGWGTRVFDFYTLDGAAALANALVKWDGGRLVIAVLGTPIKGPDAPLEFAFLADWFFTVRGIRDDVDITFVTPLDDASAQMPWARTLGRLAHEKRVHLVTDFRTRRVEPEPGLLASHDARELPFDLLVAVPMHLGATFVSATPGLGNAAGFVQADPRTLQSVCSPFIFAIGDATNVPAHKAGSVAHFEGEGLVENVARVLDGVAPVPVYDGHVHAIVETGFDRALVFDSTYDAEPRQGRFPFATIGPLTLLGESHLNHMGKMLFKWVYWNLLLPGYDMPRAAPRAAGRG